MSKLSIGNQPHGGESSARATAHTLARGTGVVTQQSTTNSGNPRPISAASFATADNGVIIASGEGSTPFTNVMECDGVRRIVTSNRERISEGHWYDTVRATLRMPRVDVASMLSSFDRKVGMATLSINNEAQRVTHMYDVLMERVFDVENPEELVAAAEEFNQRVKDAAADLEELSEALRAIMLRSVEKNPGPPKHVPAPRKPRKPKGDWARGGVAQRCNNVRLKEAARQRQERKQQGRMKRLGLNASAAAADAVVAADPDEAYGDEKYDDSKQERTPPTAPPLPIRAHVPAALPLEAVAAPPLWHPPMQPLDVAPVALPPPVRYWWPYAIPDGVPPQRMQPTAEEHGFDNECPYEESFWYPIALKMRQMQYAGPILSNLVGPLAHLIEAPCDYVTCVPEEIVFIGPGLIQFLVACGKFKQPKHVLLFAKQMEVADFEGYEVNADKRSNDEVSLFHLTRMNSGNNNPNSYQKCVEELVSALIGRTVVKTPEAMLNVVHVHFSAHVKNNPNFKTALLSQAPKIVACVVARLHSHLAAVATHLNQTRGERANVMGALQRAVTVPNTWQNLADYLRDALGFHTDANRIERAFFTDTVIDKESMNAKHVSAIGKTAVEGKTESTAPINLHVGCKIEAQPGPQPIVELGIIGRAVAALQSLQGDGVAADELPMLMHPGFTCLTGTRCSAGPHYLTATCPEAMPPIDKNKVDVKAQLVDRNGPVSLCGDNQRFVSLRPQITHNATDTGEYTYLAKLKTTCKHAELAAIIHRVHRKVNHPMHPRALYDVAQKICPLLSEVLPVSTLMSHYPEAKLRPYATGAYQLYDVGEINVPIPAHVKYEIIMQEEMWKAPRLIQSVEPSLAVATASVDLSHTILLKQHWDGSADLGEDRRILYCSGTTQAAIRMFVNDAIADGFVYPVEGDFSMYDTTQRGFVKENELRYTEPCLDSLTISETMIKSWLDAKTALLYGTKQPAIMEVIEAHGGLRNCPVGALTEAEGKASKRWAATKNYKFTTDGRLSGEWLTSCNNSKNTAIYITDAVNVVLGASTPFRLMVLGDDNLLFLRSPLLPAQKKQFVARLEQQGIVPKILCPSISNAMFCSAYLVPTQLGYNLTPSLTRITKSMFVDLALCGRSEGWENTVRAANKGTALGLAQVCAHSRLIMAYLSKSLAVNEEAIDMKEEFWLKPGVSSNANTETDDWYKEHYGFSDAVYEYVIDALEADMLPDAIWNWIAACDGYDTGVDVHNKSHHGINGMLVLANAGKDPETVEEMIKRMGPKQCMEFVAEEYTEYRDMGADKMQRLFGALVHYHLSTLEVEEAIRLHKRYNKAAKPMQKLVRKRKGYVGVLARRIGVAVKKVARGAAGAVNAVAGNMGKRRPKRRRRVRGQRMVGSMVPANEKNWRAMSGVKTMIFRPSYKHRSAPGVTCFQKTESLGTVSMTTNFSAVRYSMNPANLAYRWLANEANGFERYRVVGYRMRYVTSSATALVNGTNGAMGVVVLSFQYNVHDKIFQTRQNMENYDYTVRCAPDAKEAVCYFDGSKRHRMVEWYYVGNSVPSGSELGLWTPAYATIATDGGQNYVCGELFIDYLYECIDAHVPEGVAENNTAFYHLGLTPSTSGFLSSGTGVTNYVYSGGSDMDIVVTNAGGVDTITFPSYFGATDGAMLLVVSGAAATTLTGPAAPFTGSSGFVLQSWLNTGSGAFGATQVTNNSTPKYNSMAIGLFVIGQATYSVGITAPSVVTGSCSGDLLMSFLPTGYQLGRRSIMPTVEDPPTRIARLERMVGALLRERNGGSGDSKVNNQLSQMAGASATACNRDEHISGFSDDSKEEF